MKRISLLLFSISLTCVSYAQKLKQTFVATDIANFWMAYDNIISTKDSAQQVAFLNDLYLAKGSPGLHSLVAVRRYTPAEFIAGMTRYPQFWSSIRFNTQRVKRLYPEITSDLQKLKKAYPALQPVPIYFAIGAFRTGGTVHDKKVLIGCELSLADKQTITDELPAWRQPFYKTQDPINELALLCTHEYIHTQQKELVHNLLSTCLYEGVAEFISCHVTGKKSTTPAIEFGKANHEAVIDQFIDDMFIMTNDNNWLWGENRNAFRVRDLGYYIGYEIAERYYNLSANKSEAIAALIELDYTDENEVERIVDVTSIFPQTLTELHTAYELERPTVIQLNPFENGSQEVTPGITKITVVFSEPLVPYNTGLDFGPLGEDHCPKILPQRQFSEDGRSWTFEAELLPNQHYQILISNNFRKENGVRLKPFLIDFITAEKR